MDLPVQPHYQFRIVLSLKDNDAHLLRSLFPTAEDIYLNSRQFETFEDAARSMVNIMNAMLDDLNESGDRQFALTSEMNPDLNAGHQVRSKDWTPETLSRVWLFDKDQLNESTIKALGRGAILTVLPADPAFVLN